MDPTTALRASPFFEGLDPDMIDRVAALAMQRQYGAHETIFNQGEDAYALCFVLDGEVSLQTQVAGRLLELDVVGPGGLVAWSGLVELYTFTSTAVSLKRTTVAIIRVTDFEEALGALHHHASCVIHKNLAAVVSRRFHEVQERSARYLVGCQLDEFAMVGTGESFRKPRSLRVKHRFNRKGHYIRERYGLAGCVGCGRCGRMCLVDIKPIEVFNQLKGQPVER